MHLLEIALRNFVCRDGGDGDSDGDGAGDGNLRGNA